MQIHLAKKVFKFEWWSESTDIDEKGDDSKSNNLNSGYYHVALHPQTRRFIGIKREGVYYVYTCHPFGLSTAPRVFFKVMREMEM